MTPTIADAPRGVLVAYATFLQWQARRRGSAAVPVDSEQSSALVGDVAADPGGAPAAAPPSATSLWSTQP